MSDREQLDELENPARYDWNNGKRSPTGEHVMFKDYEALLASNKRKDEQIKEAYWLLERTESCYVTEEADKHWEAKQKSWLTRNAPDAEETHHG